MKNTLEGNVIRLLFSHHPPTHIHRTFRMKLFHKEIYLCARCSGMMSGLMSGLLLLNVLNPTLSKINFFILSTLIPLLILPATVDFIMQLNKGIESNNSRRFITGILFGISICLCIWNLFKGVFLPFTVFCITLLTIGFWFFSSYKRTEKMVEHLNLYYEYYDTCRILDLSNKLKRIRK